MRRHYNHGGYNYGCNSQCEPFSIYPQPTVIEGPMYDDEFLECKSNETNLSNLSRHTQQKCLSLDGQPWATMSRFNEKCCKYSKSDSEYMSGISEITYQSQQFRANNCNENFLKKAKELMDYDPESTFLKKIKEHYIQQSHQILNVMPSVAGNNSCCPCEQCLLKAKEIIKIGEDLTQKLTEACSCLKNKETPILNEIDSVQTRSEYGRVALQQKPQPDPILPYDPFFPDVETKGSLGSPTKLQTVSKSQSKEQSILKTQSREQTIKSQLTEQTPKSPSREQVISKPQSRGQAKSKPKSKEPTISYSKEQPRYMEEAAVKSGSREPPSSKSGSREPPSSKSRSREQTASKSGSGEQPSSKSRSRKQPVPKPRSGEERTKKQKSIHISRSKKPSRCKGKKVRTRSGAIRCKSEEFEPTLKRPHENSCERCWRYASPRRSPPNKPDQKFDPNFRKARSQMDFSVGGGGDEGDRKKVPEIVVLPQTKLPYLNSDQTSEYTPDKRVTTPVYRENQERRRQEQKRQQQERNRKTTQPKVQQEQTRRQPIVPGEPNLQEPRRRRQISGKNQQVDQKREPTIGKQKQSYEEQKRRQQIRKEEIHNEKQRQHEHTALQEQQQEDQRQRHHGAIEEEYQEEQRRRHHEAIGEEPQDEQRRRRHKAIEEEPQEEQRRRHHGAIEEEYQEKQRRSHHEAIQEQHQEEQRRRHHGAIEEEYQEKQRRSHHEAIQEQHQEEQRRRQQMAMEERQQEEYRRSQQIAMRERQEEEHRRHQQIAMREQQQEEQRRRQQIAVQEQQQEEQRRCQQIAMRERQEEEHRRHQQIAVREQQQEEQRRRQQIAVQEQQQEEQRRCQQIAVQEQQQQEQRRCQQIAMQEQIQRRHQQEQLRYEQMLQERQRCQRQQEEWEQRQQRPQTAAAEFQSFSNEQSRTKEPEESVEKRKVWETPKRLGSPTRQDRPGGFVGTENITTFDSFLQCLDPTENSEVERRPVTSYSNAEVSPTKRSTSKRLHSAGPKVVQSRRGNSASTHKESYHTALGSPKTKESPKSSRTVVKKSPRSTAGKGSPKRKECDGEGPKTHVTKAEVHSPPKSRSSSPSKRGTSPKTKTRKKTITRKKAPPRPESPDIQVIEEGTWISNTEGAAASKRKSSPPRPDDQNIVKCPQYAGKKTYFKCHCTHMECMNYADSSPPNARDNYQIVYEKACPCKGGSPVRVPIPYYAEEKNMDCPFLRSERLTSVRQTLGKPLEHPSKYAVQLPPGCDAISKHGRVNFSNFNPYENTAYLPYENTQYMSLPGTIYPENVSNQKSYGNSDHLFKDSSHNRGKTYGVDNSSYNNLFKNTEYPFQQQAEKRPRSVSDVLSVTNDQNQDPYKNLGLLVRDHVQWPPRSYSSPRSGNTNGNLKYLPQENTQFMPLRNASPRNFQDSYGNLQMHNVRNVKSMSMANKSYKENQPSLENSENIQWVTMNGKSPRSSNLTENIQKQRSQTHYQTNGGTPEDENMQWVSMTGGSPIPSRNAAKENPSGNMAYASCGTLPGDSSHYAKPRPSSQPNAYHSSPSFTRSAEETVKRTVIHNQPSRRFDYPNNMESNVLRYAQYSTIHQSNTPFLKSQTLGNPENTQWMTMNSKTFPNEQNTKSGFVSPRRYCVFYMTKDKESKKNDVEVLVEEFESAVQQKKDVQATDMKEKLQKVMNWKPDSMALRFQKGVYESCGNPPKSRTLYF